ncbi:hypothetical protein [Paracidovorax valerianellae]|uniref:Uncharacterized protein n=1 Tax=Paracidovorax valerianellae TaxID=187868 RepID=A0A1G6M880_9BURK|nr:hypothetical protein [Paracidovorax valerianellae]MDA8446069.1 hypothetical protein [Paracidovorax valerianellae]SDC51514.1 hypothetical protein SAMN05192589_102344 [Paracidovorax valerianellae]
MAADRITIAFEDQSQGYAISPDRVPLSMLAEFSADVAKLVRGSEKDVDTDEIEVQIIEGSLAFAFPLPSSGGLLKDLRALAESSDLARIDHKRRTVLERWQASARKTAHRIIKIATSAISQAIVIDKDSDFVAREIDQWVSVERYVRGEITDLGGAGTSNAHVVLPDGKKLTVRTDKELILAERSNLVYKTVHLRIRAKLNIATGELQDASLIEFVNYQPSFNEDEFRRFTDKGKKAWADVDDPAQWVRELRGSQG